MKRIRIQYPIYDYHRFETYVTDTEYEKIKNMDEINLEKSILKYTEDFSQAFPYELKKGIENGHANIVMYPSQNDPSDTLLNENITEEENIILKKLIHYTTKMDQKHKGTYTIYNDYILNDIHIKNMRHRKKETCDKLMKILCKHGYYELKKSGYGDYWERIREKKLF